MNPEPLSAPRTIVSPRLPFTMPTHQLIPPTLCTRSHERLRNEPNFTGRSRNTPANLIYERKPIPSDRHRPPLTLNTRPHENTKRTRFPRNRLQTKPICLPRRTRFHPNSTAMPPRHRQALFRIALYWHFPCSESASRLPPLVSCTSASKHWAAKPACAALSRPSES